VVLATGGALTGHVVQAIEGAHAPTHHRQAHIARLAPQNVKVDLAREWANPTSSLTAHSSGSTALSRTSTKARHRLPKPPSKSLDYLALGTPASASHDSSAASHKSSAQPSAHLASIASPATKSEGSGPPAKSGGGTSLSYLGR
jgi:hypothetical protein